MHQAVTNAPAAAAVTEDVAETGIAGVTGEDVSQDDIELTQDTGNSQIVLDDTKLEEMTRISSSCKTDNKVGELRLYQEYIYIFLI